MENRSARGFEAWLLAPANTPEAIEMARRENSVIALDESNHPYMKFADESLILSTMAHSAWMRESEYLGAAILDKFESRLDSPNRGLKQTELIVLIGAAMPKILVEIGFISNRLEEKKLGQSAYRQKIAQSLFEAIMQFKETYDGTLRAEKS
ncbi:MAG: N-acetylmuramoyl-L-alanine amidase [Candidatus Marinimicrobia bacterium]|nr:N-acetylmuramoyl-L-alanine amidase [Candidatus Neomarinimicrobiota bacterium]